MRLALFCVGLFFSITLFAQRTEVPYLPSIRPDELGFNQDSIDQLYDRMENMRDPNYLGLVVIKDQQLAIEWYFNTFWRTHIHDIRSAGKSITSLILGAAIQDGLVKDLEQNVYSFFPKDKYPGLHEDYKTVKIKDLLDMSSGLDADSDNWDTPGNARKWITADEWVQYILTIPVVRQPGTRWVYADINAALIGAIIEEKSGMSLRDYAHAKIFGPLDFQDYYWTTNKANQTVAAGNFYLSTLDFAKLGALITSGGKWGEEQIIDADYIDRLLKHKVFNINDYNPLADQYGMLWYKSTRVFDGEEISYLWASGNGGNHLVVVPEKNMVVAMTAYGYGQWNPHLRNYAILEKVLNALD